LISGYRGRLLLNRPHVIKLLLFFNTLAVAAQFLAAGPTNKISFFDIIAFRTLFRVMVDFNVRLF
jgi:hypothetical protein